MKGSQQEWSVAWLHGVGEYEHRVGGQLIFDAERDQGSMDDLLMSCRLETVSSVVRVRDAFAHLPGVQMQAKIRHKPIFVSFWCHWIWPKNMYTFQHFGRQ